MKRKKIYNDASKNDSLLKANFYDDNDESSNVSNSSEVKEWYPSICDDVIENLDLRALRKKNLNKLITAHLNFRSLRNKLEFLKEKI